MSRTSISLVAAIVLAACAESSVVEPGQGGGAPSGEAGAAPGLAASPSRPAGGTCTFVVTPLPPEPGQPPNVLRRHIDELCQLKHLGRATGSTERTITVTPTGPVLTDRSVYTAANGDQLFVAFSGTATPPDQSGVITFSGTETVTGGTGRFAGASGSLSRTGSFSVATQSGRFESSGTLSY